MRRASTILMISVVGNLALAAVWAKYRAEPVVQQPARQEVVKAPEKVIPPDQADPGRWERLNRGTDAEVIARLREEGFPRFVLSDIAYGRLNRKYDRRRRELGVEVPIEYWQRGYFSGEYRQSRDPQAKALRKQLNEEYTKELKEMLPADERENEFDHLRHQREFGQLAVDKVQQVEAINKDYQELRSQIREDSRGITFPEDREKLDFLEKERRADLQKVLTPQELEDYDLRSSDIARSLRSQLVRLDVSEDEFKAIFRAQRAYDAKYGTSSLSSVEARELREAEMKAVLSPERLEEYQVKTSGSYEPLAYLAKNLQLSETVIADVIHLQHDIEHRTAAVQNDNSLTQAQKDAQFAVLAAEATEKLEIHLGAEGAKQFANGPSSAWLTQLKPRKGIRP